VRSLRGPPGARGRGLLKGASEAQVGIGSLPPLPAPRWVPGPVPDLERVAILERELSLPGALCALLVTRGFHDPDAAKTFLRPSLSGLNPPNALQDMAPAVQRILGALEAGETIFVHGDYDVDGMAGTALLTRWLRRLGGTVAPFVPHRVRDGYDLGPAGLEAAAAAGASLMVTVDCGILAHGALAEARVMGMDVIVTDHHTPDGELPPALAVLNPNRADGSYPDRGLCGAGVVYKLCQALAQARGLSQGELHPLLDLVGMATIADLVPLTGENRILARFGLRALAQTRNLGLRALMAHAGIGPEQLSAGAVGFVLAPRLNAVGRLGDASRGLRLLLTEDQGEADRLAREAAELNRERQEEDRRILGEAISQLAGSYDPGRDFAVVLDSDGWHPGVIGIVASRVVELVHRPAVLVSLQGDRGRGSGRSIPPFHLLEGIRACAPHLERFGGHRQAAGMEILRHHLPAFREAFNGEARRALEGHDLRPSLHLEAEVRLEDLSWDLHKYLKYFGPHGMGNPRPLFVARGVSLTQTGRVVGSQHLKLHLRQGRTELEAIGFRMAQRLPPAALGLGPLDVAFQLQENEYRGARRLQANLKDLRPSGVAGT
jgi:single-stranded-DNA-specific exonuclease